ncbi:hypothetical protein BUALT_Bualt01G0160900 [Buddleja alternifolia]|uniref:Uncharacterized protein n=1 Tax=Buddleja alternifolia TaxID=168488 RepID=A0AAV6YI01_9LAMI|nr:hypothetical protein BUALT_Bualt01G0160900 [Buddleja alternifolia]
MENHHPKSDALSASLDVFRSKISNFLSQILLKPEPGPEFTSLTLFNKCFELIHITNKAFAKLVVEIDYPMTRWGGKATDDYLNYTLNLLDLLNSITSSISHLNQAKISIFHALALIKNSSPSAAKHLKKIIPRKNLSKELKFEGGTGIEEKRYSSEKECVIIEAVMVLKKIGFMALGIVLSGLCGDAKPYLEIRKYAGGFDDSLIKGLDLRFCKEMAEIQGGLEEVKEVNCATDRLCEAISGGRYMEAVRELKRRLEVLENSMQGIEKETNSLFSEVLGTRNKLLDNLRVTGQNH